MLTRRLRPGRRDRPDFAGEVDFVPTRGQRLARSRRRQNAKLESARRRRWMFAEARGESRNVTVRHGRKMAPRQLGALRQQLVEMAAPARRVGFVAADEASRLGRIQNLLDAPSEARGGFRRARPLGLENRKHGFRINRVNGHLSDRLAIARERHRPLRLVLVVAPSALVHGEEIIRSLAERRDFRFIRLVPFGDRIDASLDQRGPSAAFSRAVFNDTPPLLAEPRPASRSLPRHVKRKTQRRRPSAEIER